MDRKAEKLTLDFMQMKEQMVKSCTVCGGSGFINNENICSCLSEFRVRHRLLDGQFSPELIAQEVVDIIGRVTYADERSKKVADWYLENLDLVDEGGLSIIIYGSQTGIGKTSLATMFAKAYTRYFLSEESYKVDMDLRFMEGGEFYDASLNTYDESYKRLIDSWNVDLFIYDELGKEPSSPKGLSRSKRMLENFLRHRRRIVRPTIITTNLIPAELFARFGEYVQSLLGLDTVGEMGKGIFRSVELIGEDFRTNPAKTLWGV